MRFSWDFLQNMLENGHSNLQTNLWVHITSNIFKISNSKITGSHQPPPDLPTLKAYPTPGVGGRFEIFSLKWRERMNLKVPWAILPLGCAILSTRAKTVRGVGTTPPRRTRVNRYVIGVVDLNFDSNFPRDIFVFWQTRQTDVSADIPYHRRGWFELCDRYHSQWRTDAAEIRVGVSPMLFVYLRNKKTSPFTWW